MREFKGKVAVVTGAGSGIGRGLAHRFAREGCKVALADISDEALTTVESELCRLGATTLAVETDVSDSKSVEKLAQATLDEFGAAHIVCNNAGVAVAPGGGLHVWDTPLAEWEWVLGANLWGIIHGCRAFMPILLEQDEEAHVVNTVSIAGLLARGTTHVYNMTKHAALSLTESLALQLQETNPKIGVSALCPGFVRTNLMRSHLNAPDAVKRLEEKETDEHRSIRSKFERVIADGTPADVIAGHVVEAIRAQRVYILTHPEYNDLIRMRVEAILNDGTLDRYGEAYNAFLEAQANRAGT